MLRHLLILLTFIILIPKFTIGQKTNGSSNYSSINPRSENFLYWTPNEIRRFLGKKHQKISATILYHQIVISNQDTFHIPAKWGTRSLEFFNDSFIIRSSSVQGGNQESIEVYYLDSFSNITTQSQSNQVTKYQHVQGLKSKMSWHSKSTDSLLEFELFHYNEFNLLTSSKCYYPDSTIFIRDTFIYQEELLVKHQEFQLDPIMIDTFTTVFKYNQKGQLIEKIDENDSHTYYEYMNGKLQVVYGGQMGRTIFLYNEFKLPETIQAGYGNMTYLYLIEYLE